MDCRYCDYYTNSARCTCNDSIVTNVAVEKRMLKREIKDAEDSIKELQKDIKFFKKELAKLTKKK